MKKIVVIGGGTMGLVNAQVAKAFGARVIVSDISQKKIKRAQEMGVDVVDAKNNDPVEAVKDLTNGKGADIVMFGHTHIPVIDYDDDIIALNPGSLSHPRQEGHQPSYILMEIDKTGQAHFSIHFLKKNEKGC